MERRAGPIGAAASKPLTPPVWAHPEAADELDAAVAWYEAEREGLGHELKAAVDEAIHRLATGLLARAAMRGRLRGTGLRRIMLSRFPYDLVYEPSETEILIIAFSHHSRRPGYWRSRLDSSGEGAEDFDDA